MKPQRKNSGAAGRSFNHVQDCNKYKTKRTESASFLYTAFFETFVPSTYIDLVIFGQMLTV